MTSKSNQAGQSETTRREFLRRAAGAATLASIAAAFPSIARGAINFPQVSRRRVLGANDRVGVGFIGCGGRQWSHLNSVHWLKTQKNALVELVAACDVYRPRLNKVVDEYKKHSVTIKGYSDHRALLRDPNVDIVCIATPDHHHAYQTIDAARAGKDIYCEKPFTHWRQFDLLKRAVAEVKRSNVIFQLGTQGMSDSAWHQARKLIQDGLIGQPIHAECGMFRDSDWGERGMTVDDPNAKPGQDLDWNAFLGDAPKRKFDVSRFFRWRLYEDYSGGPVTDVYPHCFTPVAFMMNTGFPSHVVASGGVFRWPERDVPDSFHLMADYPQKMSVAVLGTFGSGYNGGDGVRGSGARSPVLRGWEGALTFQGSEIVFIPCQGAKHQAQRIPIEHGENQVDHWENFLACVRNHDVKTYSPIDLADQVQTTLIMAAWSLKHHKVARFDARREAIML